MCQKAILEAIETVSREASLQFFELSKPVLSQFRVNLFAVFEVRNHNISPNERAS